MRTCAFCHEPIDLHDHTAASSVVVRHQGDIQLLYCDYGCEEAFNTAKKPVEWFNWLILALVCVLVVGLVLYATRGAWAATDPDSPLPYKDWFESVHNKEGTWCCTVADGHMTDYSYDGQNYKVKIEGQFYLIPWNSPIISIRHDKPFIGGVIWWYKNTDGTVAIRCFVADDAT